MEAVTGRKAGTLSLKRSPWEGIFLIDKPFGLSSNKVLQILRKAIGFQKMGHLGTLDPIATGVLPVFIGWTTKIIPFVSDSPKGYQGTLILGKKTDTQDVSGEIIFNSPGPIPSEETIREVMARFLGNQQQIPPSFSALKYKGKPLYRWARQGIQISKPPRQIFIEALEVLAIDGDQVAFEVLCSPGTYIRTLCMDIGDGLGCGACLKSLKRTRNGDFDISQASPLEKILKASSPSDIEALKIPAERLLQGLPVLRMNGHWREKVKLGCLLKEGSGLSFPFPVQAGKPICVKSFSEELWAIYEWTGPGGKSFKPLRVLI